MGQKPAFLIRQDRFSIRVPALLHDLRIDTDRFAARWLSVAPLV